MAAEQSPAKAGIARLQSAAALLAVGRLEDAALAARKAATEGATPESVLHVLGAIAHAGPGADAGAIGRALAATTPDPQALALAATLLVEAGCVDEAVDVYDRALPYLGREQAAIAQFSKADALFYLGRWDDAAVGYTAVDRRQLSDTASALLRSRLRVLTLEAQSPLLWQGSLADLERASKAEGPAGAADLYTLAQVQQVLGDPVHALESFAALSGRFPTLVAGVVGEQHWLALSSRLSTLIAENRALDALALHRAGWADALLPRVTDPQVLSVVAAEYARAGLSASALAAWRVVADVERRGALDSRETVLAITQLYVDQAAYVDAIDAAAWFRKHPLPLERRGEVALLEGRALVGLGKTAEAREKFRLAARSTASSASATARVALLDAATGACEAAIPVLATVAAEPPDDLDRVVLNDALVACMVSTGNEAGAAAPALLSAGDTPDAKTQSMRTYQAMRLSGAATPGILTDAAESAPGVWGQLAREERAHRELTARLK
jgi:tetratricopeptide (TPR) repeat protein